MTYKQHRWAAAVFAAMTILALPAPGLLLLVPGFFLGRWGGLIPDIDHKGSFVSRRLPVVYYLYKFGLSNPLTWMLFGKENMQGLVKHRYGTHTLLALFGGALLMGVFLTALLTGLSNAVEVLIQGGTNVGAFLQRANETLPVMFLAEGAWLPYGELLGPWGQAGVYLSICFFVGYASHILLDIITESGVPIFYPWSSKRIGLPRFLRFRTR